MGFRTSTPANAPLRYWNHLKPLHLFPKSELNCPLDSKSEWSVYGTLNSSFTLGKIICLIILVIIKYICGRPGEWKETFPFRVFPFFQAKPNLCSPQKPEHVLLASPLPFNPSFSSEFDPADETSPYRPPTAEAPVHFSSLPHSVSPSTPPFSPPSPPPWGVYTHSSSFTGDGWCGGSKTWTHSLGWFLIFKSFLSCFLALPADSSPPNLNYLSIKFLGKHISPFQILISIKGYIEM